MKPIRLLDLGWMSPLRSQTLYHAVAYAMGPEDPDTILLVSPTAPYVCIGYHQDLEREVDVAYCRQRGLPVLRREVGGGAVYLDRNQLFTQWVFHRDHLPLSLEKRLQLYIRPLVDTYRDLGIEAYYRPLNDIHVAGRKIGGTGAASIGEAEVLVGSLMFDFDFDTMARVLKVPSEKMRDKVRRSMREYITTLKRELGRIPDWEEVKALYLRKCAEALGREIVPGTLSKKEEAMVRELDARFLSEEWLYQKGKLREPGVKIHEDVRVLEGRYKAPGGLIRVIARIRKGRIDDLTITGDFTLLPAFAVGALEQAVRGLDLRREVLLPRIRDVYRMLNVDPLGVTPEDFVEAILTLSGEPVGTGGRS